MTPQPMNKPLPHAQEAERVILGTVLLDNELIVQAIESLTPEDFYSPMHRRVFTAMRDLYHERKIIDPVFIGEKLKLDDSLESVGGVAAITNLSFGVPYTRDLDEYVDAVRKKAMVRKLVKRATQIAADAMAEDCSPDETLLNAQKSINDLYLENSVNDNDEHFIPLRRVIENEVIPGLDRLLKGETKKIRTGFPGLDEAVGGGISASDVMLIAGLPSSGKSALALQIAYQCAASGSPAAFLAGEMTNHENVNRILSQLSGMVNLNSLTHITQTEHDLLTDWALKIADVPLYLDCRLSDLHSIGARLRALTRRYGLKLVVLDYIQLFKLEKMDKRQRTERLTEVSQEVKRLANELGVAIISVAQFNREGAKSGKPSMHDLEGASQLEKDASLIFIIDRIGDTEAQLRIVKGRNTGTGTLYGNFNGRCVRFEIG